MNFIKTGDQLSGTISSGSPYSRDSNCLWTLEAPAGSRVSIEFTRFFTEKDADWVQIWVRVDFALFSYTGSSNMSFAIESKRSSFERE